jgi:hypothetical protein
LKGVSIWSNASGSKGRSVPDAAAALEVAGRRETASRQRS